MKSKLTKIISVLLFIVLIASNSSTTFSENSAEYEKGYQDGYFAGYAAAKEEYAGAPAVNETGDIDTTQYESIDGKIAQRNYRDLKGKKLRLYGEIYNIFEAETTPYLLVHCNHQQFHIQVDSAYGYARFDYVYIYGTFTGGVNSTFNCPIFKAHAIEIDY